MTATLNQQGHIVLPPEANEAAHTHPGEEFHVMVSSSGVIMLRPKRKHRRSLVQHFQAIGGLETNRLRDPLPDPPSL